MAKGKGGGRFQPGVSGNPGGRPRLPDDIREARRLNQFELERLVNKYLWLARDAFKAAAADTETPAIELMIGSIISQAIEKGDQMRLDFILNRLIGRVVERVELQVEPLTIHRSNGEEVVLTSKPKKEGA